MPSPEEPRSIVYRVTGRDEGSRLDLFLKERIPRMSREGIKEAIRARVAVAGRERVRPSTALHAGDEVTVTYPEGERAGAIGAAPQILHEDDELLVVDKPAGMLVHATSRSTSLSLLGALRAAGREGLHLVHRLDRETSGLVVLAKGAGAAGILSRAFARGEVEKTYVAIVFGAVPGEEGVVDLPLGRAVRSAVHIKQGIDREGGRAARTEYRVRERLDGFTCLSLRPRTGRRHQIRVHLQAIGHPIVGDKLYAAGEAHHLRHLASGFDERMRRDLLAERQLLHAEAVAFRHPAGGREVRFEAPLPPDMREFLLRSGGSSPSPTAGRSGG
jgi:23S rRNA pseudouridine1911/1915/1917 synthase